MTTSSADGPDPSRLSIALAPPAAPETGAPQPRGSEEGPPSTAVPLERRRAAPRREDPIGGQRPAQRRSVGAREGGSGDSRSGGVLLQRDARGVFTLTLNDPACFNALGSAMLAALQSAIDRVASDSSARVLVLAAQGKAFCAGHDLKEMAAFGDLASHQALFAQCSRMMLSLQKLPVPVIAKVQGMATAAGCQLVAQCDLAVASSAASFATSGIRHGLFCATPSVPLVRNLPLKKAMELLLTGDFIDAATALDQGLLNRVVAPEALDAAVEQLVQAILDKPRVAVAMGKALVYQQRELGVEAAYQLAGQTMAVNMQHADAQEGVTAFVQKREPAWRGRA